MKQETKDDVGGPNRFRRRTPWLIAALILLLPLVAMRLTDEVNWDETDFAVMGSSAARRLQRL